MPSDQTGLISPPPAGSSGLSLGSDDGTKGGGGFASWSQGKKIGVIGGGFAILALGAYILAKRKSSQATTSTAPEVIQPSNPNLSTPSGTGSSGGNSAGSGGGTFQGNGTLTNDFALLQSELLQLINAKAPVNNGGPGSAANPTSLSLQAAQGLNQTSLLSTTVGPLPAQSQSTLQASNNAAAVNSYVAATGGTPAQLNAYEAYAASLPAGGLAPGQPVSAQSQALLNTYNALANGAASTPAPAAQHFATTSPLNQQAMISAGGISLKQLK